MPIADTLALPFAPGRGQPTGFPQALYDPAGTLFTPARFALGRRLFYDPSLSVDGSISCASCHHQQGAFSDPERALSLGINQQSGLRNAPALQNLRWKPHFMWDGGIIALEVQPIAPITEPLEMAHDLRTLIQQLNAHPDYPRLFAEAWGSQPITSQQLLQSLAQFLTALVSAQGPWDRFAAGDSAALGPQARQGWVLFQQHCQSCHQPPLFSNFDFHQNGRPPSPHDVGRGRITERAADNGFWAVPSLRNVAFSPPYFHDGSAATLDDVLRHYAQPFAGPASGTLAQHTATGIPLSATDQAALRSFLDALSDTAFVRQPLFGPPPGL
jgi:cytochrome c peroxidase